MTEDNFQDWIGRTETAEEKVTQRVVSAFNATFDLRDGTPCSLPATKPVPVYEVRVDADEVSVVLP